jgi:DNA-binding NtrC family response regulator
MFRKSPQSYDLVITDQTMPEVTGIKLAEEFLKIRPDIPIILNTGYSSIITEDEAKKLGVKAFVMKPIESKKLARLVRQVLDE